LLAKNGAQLDAQDEVCSCCVIDPYGLTLIAWFWYAVLHQEGYTALAWASGRGNIASVLALVRLGARVDIENKVIMRLCFASVDNFIVRIACCFAGRRHGTHIGR
jgi:hypothetical protein